VKGVSRTAQLRMLGNACQVQVGEAIGFHLAELLQELE
jgi:site-specific DNA-cytosine methylase